MFSDCVAISHYVIIFLVIEVKENELHIDINGKYDRGACFLRSAKKRGLFDRLADILSKLGVLGDNGTGKLKCERRGRRLGAP